MDALMAAVLGSETPPTAARPIAADNPCMFAVLLETQTCSVADRLSEVPHLCAYKCFSSTVQNEGRRGQGVAILVHPTVADSTRLVQVGGGPQPGALQSVWLRVSGDVFGLGGDVMLGGCYIPPQGQNHSADETFESFAALHSQIDEALGGDCAACFVAGDLNARLGIQNEFDDEHYPELVGQFPELGAQRRDACNRSPNANHAGRLLLDVAATAQQGMIITTGRGRGDEGQPTCMNVHQKLVTRTEHILVSPALYALAHTSRTLTRPWYLAPGLDHAALRLDFAVHAPLPGVDGGGFQKPEHQCGPGCAVKLGTQVLKSLPKEAQARFTAACQASLQSVEASLQDSLAAEDVEGSLTHLMQAVESAAHSCGLTRLWQCPFTRRGVRNPVQQKPWYNARCAAAKLGLRQAIFEGHCPHARRRLKHEYERLVKRSKRSYISQAAAGLLALLCQRSPEAYGEIKRRVGKKKSSSPSPIAAERWEEYVRAQFTTPAPPPPPNPGPGPVPDQPGEGRFPRREQFVATRGRAQEWVPVGRTRRGQSAPIRATQSPPRLSRSGSPRPGPVPDPDPDTGPQAAVPMPGLDWFRQATKQAISRLDPNSAAGFDGVPASFFKACVHEDGQPPRRVLAEPLARLFCLCYTKGVLPVSWREARLSPLYKKKGPLLDPNSYRMLAVNSVFYRLFANVVRAVTTDWCVATGAIPETQFGFYPGRDTAQPVFVLRHLVHAAKRAAANSEPGRTNSRLFVAFMDFTQAYDRIDRTKLWAHLESIGVPGHLMRAIRGMYTGDTYTLVEGPKRTNPVHPTRGVKQGCPLSPLLFSLFINDFAAHTNTLQTYGVPLRTGNRVVSHLFYADDLALISYSEEGLRSMLVALHDYAERKGLTVNAAKSEVVVFNTRALPVRRRGGNGVVTLTYGGAVLATKSEFKYLGFALHNRMSMQKTHAPRARGLMAAVSDVMRQGKELGLARSPWAMVKLFQTYAVPSGMYGCQVWGTRYAQFSRMFDAEVSKRHLRYLKRMLGLPYSTSNWAVLAEVSCRPFHFYWVRALCRFHTRLLGSNSPLLVDVAKADAALAAEGSGDCWSAEFGRALESIACKAGEAELGRSWCESVFAGDNVNAGTVARTLEQAYEIDAWGGFDQVADLREHLRAHQGQQGSRSKSLTYFCWFKLPEPGWPHYLRGLHHSRSQSMLKQLARFRLGAHTLRVEMGRRQDEVWEARTCQRCSQAHLQSLACPVDDEHHCIFDCAAFEHLRASIPGVQELIANSAGCVRTFMSGEATVVRNYVAACMDTLDALR